ncbi:uncharacterized protein BYT42DRAFT_477292, partial [Radiomyces spectabilis]|uniref:uncharacterized protein n=1 Tax=Radiomyces spectabilis TaxID=64574 RepID=UPI00221FA45E
KELFTNVVRTDGYAIDFVFARRKYEALPNLTMDDFTTDKLQGTFQLWGADPGMTEVFVASDGHDENPHQVRKFSTDEFYTVAGFKKTNSKVLNLKRRITILAQSVQEVESGLSGRKTSDKAIFIEHLRNWLPTLHLLLNFYDERFCALRFLNYIGKQRAEAEIVDIFLDGGKKYNKRGTKTKRRNQEKDRKTKKK